MTEYENEPGAEQELVLATDERQFVEIGVDHQGSIAHVAIDGAWPEEMTKNEFAAALMEAFGNATLARVEQLNEQNDAAAGRTIPRVTPIAERVRARAEEVRAARASGGGHGESPEPTTDPRRQEVLLEEARRTAELAARARDEREGYRSRLLELHSTEHEDTNSEHTITLVSRYGAPVRFELTDIWARRRPEPLARAVVEVAEAAMSRRVELERGLAEEFPATTELIARSTAR